jgi:hypothetical protein
MTKVQFPPGARTFLLATTSRSALGPTEPYPVGSAVKYDAERRSRVASTPASYS